MSKFPKKLFVKMEKDGHPSPAVDLTDIAELGERLEVGIYELRETIFAKGIVVTSRKASR